MSVTPAQWRRTVHSKNYIIRKARQHDPGLRSTEGCGAADSLCNGRDPLHGRHQQILQPRRFQSILRRTVPKRALPHSPSKLLRRWVSLLDAVYGARHWPGSLVHAPETLFYAHLVPLFCDVGIWPLCPGTVAVRKRDDSDHPDGRFLPNSARAQVVDYPLSAGLTIPPHDGEPAPVVLPSPVSIDPSSLLFSLGETSRGPRPNARAAIIRADGHKTKFHGPTRPRLPPVYEPLHITLPNPQNHDFFH